MMSALRNQSFTVQCVTSYSISVKQAVAKCICEPLYNVQLEALELELVLMLKSVLKFLC